MLQAKERQDLIKQDLAIPRMDNSDFEMISDWHEAQSDNGETYHLFDSNGSYVGEFMSIDLEFKTA